MSYTRPFKFWCQNILPLVYDDSLSYYETLCKLTKYVNTLNDGLGTACDELDNVNLSIEQLWDALNNIDVDESVSNKLEEMLQDGSLGSILSNITNYATYQNTDFAKQMVYSVAMSYYMEMWKTRNPVYDYGNVLTPGGDGRGTCLDPLASSITRLDCSTFVIMCLLGVPYQHSKYVNANYDQKPMFGINRNFWETPNNNTGLIRWASDIYEYADKTGQLFEIASDYSNLQTGDVVFWKWKDEYLEANPDATFAHQAYNHVGHTALIIDGCTDYANNIGIVQASNAGDLMNMTALSGFTPTTQDLCAKAFRPKYNISSAYVNGIVRYRNRNANGNLVFSSSGLCYSGGLMPNNTTYVSVNQNGEVVTNRNISATTMYMPYNRSVVVTMNTTAFDYYFHYYNSQQEYIETYVNSAPYVDEAVYLRIEVCVKNQERYPDSSVPDSDIKPMTDTRIAEAITSTTIRFHNWCDTPDIAYPATGRANLYDRDSIFYFPTLTHVEPLNELRFA